jgi:hypothetical protein
MQFKRPTRKSSVFETYLKSTGSGAAVSKSDSTAQQSPPADSDKGGPQDPIDVALAYLEVAGPTTTQELLKEMNIGSSRGLMALQTMEDYRLVTKEIDDEGRAVFTRVPAD